MIAAIRLRGGIKMKKEMRATLDMLGMKKVNSLVVLPNNTQTIGMIKKVESFVAWGELSPSSGVEKKMNLKPPKGGLNSIKMKYPKGDLGYHGDKINDLIKRMM